jgi:hypothetical protein
MNRIRLKHHRVGMVGYDCIFCVGKEKDYTTQQIVVAIYEDQ